MEYPQGEITLAMSGCRVPLICNFGNFAFLASDLRHAYFGSHSKLIVSNDAVSFSKYTPVRVGAATRDGGWARAPKSYFDPKNEMIRKRIRAKSIYIGWDAV